MVRVPRLFFRTEASTEIGMGHFMRCFAIAEEARGEGSQVTFLMNRIDNAVMPWLEQIGAFGQVLPTTIGSDDDLAHLDLSRQDWLVIDSYKATAAYVAAARQRACVAVIDDLNALACYDCDLLINTALSASATDYADKTSARLLLGADYALVREEFCAPRRPTADQPFVVVMFGGSDPTGLTPAVATALHAAMSEVTVRVIAGPANRQIAVLQALSKKYPRIQLHISPPSVAQVLYGAELVLTAAGGSVGEIAAMGLAALVLVVYDNQKAALEACPFPVMDVRDGLPLDLANRVKRLLADPSARDEIASHAAAMIDGEGPVRILNAMKSRA